MKKGRKVNNRFLPEVENNLRAILKNDIEPIHKYDLLPYEPETHTKEYIDAIRIVINRYKYEGILTHKRNGNNITYHPGINTGGPFYESL